MTQFERAVVFRVARGYFFAMAVLAVVVFVGGAVVGVRGLSGNEIPKPVQPAGPAGRRQLDVTALIANVERQRARTAQAGSTIELKPHSGRTANTSAPEEDALDAALKALHAVFPDPPYSWENEVEQTCTTPTSFGCLQWGTRIKRYGVVGVLSKAFEGMDRAEAIDFLGVLTRTLKLAPVEKRLDLVVPIIQAEREARADFESQQSKYKRTLEEAQTKYQTEVEADHAKHTQWRQLGLYGLALGFGLLITVSLFLAFLSMERHTRALETLLAQNASRTAWTSDPIATNPGAMLR